MSRLAFPFATSTHKARPLADGLLQSRPGRLTSLCQYVLRTRVQATCSFLELQKSSSQLLEGSSLAPCLGRAQITT